MTTDDHEGVRTRRGVLIEGRNRGPDLANHLAPNGAGIVLRSTAVVHADDALTVRDWAKANGHKVSDRGRIIAEVQKAYDAAH